MDLLLIKMEKVDDSFYERLLQFISENGYQPKIIAHSIDSLTFKELEISPSKRQVLRHKKEVPMMAKEFDILEFLAENRGQVFSKEQIYDYVWGENYISDD